VSELLTNASARWAGSDRRGPLLLVLAGVGVAVAVGLRLAPIGVDFPFGDGGLFWVMANDLRESGFVPPAVTSYNTGDIPWVYPPLGLYLVASLGGDLDLFRILPAAWAIATLPAFWLLARALIGERGALVALVAYGLAAPAYSGLIAGGGVTRGPGLVLALLTMWAVVRGHVLGAGLLGGLVLLTHPIAAAYALLGSATLWATRGMNRRMLLAPLVSLAVGAIWIIPMIARHGFEPFGSALRSRELQLGDNVFVLLADALNPPNLAFTIGLVGVAVAVRRRRWDLIAWLLVSVFGLAVVDRWMAIPLAVLAGLAVDAALEHPARLASVALLAVAGVVAVTGVLLAHPIQRLTAEQRATIEWAGAESSPDATFAVVGYDVDRAMVEWFPALSQRRNLTAWQGSEWHPAGDRRDLAKAWASCQATSCLPAADYYVLQPDCCPGIANGLAVVHPHVYARED
jgi:hypothetical protein